MKFFKLIISCFLLIFLTGVISSCNNKDSNTITIFAASSLKLPLDQIISQFESEHNAEIKVNYGGSNQLQRQIEQGVEVDLFISASSKQFDQLKSHDNIFRKDSKFLSNRLVLITHQDSTQQEISSNTELFTLLKSIHEDDMKLSIGNPSTVPAGTYAKEALTDIDVYHHLKEHIILTKDVTSSAQHVIQKNSQYAIVYHSDYIKYKKDTKRIHTFNQSMHTPISYSMGAFKNSDRSDAMNQNIDQLYQYIKSRDNIFKKYGFKEG